MSTSLLIMLVAAYLIGSMSGARITSRLFNTSSPIEHGSKNPGATNMYRIAGFKPAICTFTIDVFKGTIPLWGAYFLGFQPLELGLIAISCCIGHIFPIYHKFRGGKAVATAFGVLLPIGLELGVALALTWIVTAYKTRYSSIASIVAVSLAPLFVWLLKPKYTYAVCMLTALIIIRHIPNIKRLLQGCEPTIDNKRERNS
ncbi:hypothetical protein DS2_10512 [Catenovulum agarivorans DS-2]|uniref:Glycerol-3-phosphate acyltransferase n=1 Tax=Catenovulum agarivorans DS-2 TaxID=1328313 RepID=W7QLQ9_9ALTE|nr:glycerol-3-phosphate 1-O-acyltransferase PlsY [Catenovulum agarivorans]EWH09872.1 hypothetical protein DS2_10512 [Catenovulum agarivorans DS-2]